MVFHKSPSYMPPGISRLTAPLAAMPSRHTKVNMWQRKDKGKTQVTMPYSPLGVEGYSIL